VIIPHIDRNTECGIKSLQGEILPLHNFITEELEKQLKAYNPNEFRAIIGHSFSASFALYS
jgi:S-formylglutathione hydrolase FrmB